MTKSLQLNEAIKLKYFLFLFAIIPFISLGQKKSKYMRETGSDPLKWINATVNLECRKDRFENLELQATAHSLQENLQPIHRSSGTAIFLEDKKKRYLITNRHVLYDADAVEQKHRLHLQLPADDTYSIFMKILRIPRIGETRDSTVSEMPLGLLDVPSYAKGVYVYSNPDEDLAIISLDGQGHFPIFADLLIAKGYKPITLSDLDTTAMNYGQDLMAIGYPLVGFEQTINLTIQKAPWYSNLAIEPVVTFGRLAVPSIHRYYFISDITIAPGNSGGPVISNNKMVGIISSQGMLPLEDAGGKQIDSLHSRYPYAFAIKSANIFPLLLEMQRKDEQNAPKN